MGEDQYLFRFGGSGPGGGVKLIYLSRFGGSGRGGGSMFTPRAAGRMEDAGQIAGNYPKVEKGVK